MLLGTEGRAPKHARLLARAVRRDWRILLGAGLSSGAVNVLALTGPLYMLEVYNSALPSGSPTHLAALTLVMLGLYALSGLFDFMRTRLMAAAGLRADRALSASAFALQQAQALERRPGGGAHPLRDVDQIRAFVSGPGPTALFDLPWMPLYLAVIYAMHPLLGVLATAGAIVLVGLMLLADFAGRAAAADASQSAAQRWRFADSASHSAEAARAMAITPNLVRRWNTLSANCSAAERKAARWPTAGAAAIRVARPALQSATLGLGAYLFMLGEASAGAMIAASIILSRALAPVETAIAHWRAFGAAHQSYRRLIPALASLPQPSATLATPPAPHQGLAVADLAVSPPGETAAVITDVSFCLSAGDGLGIVGPSGSGKSTLARALVGVWQAQSGIITLDRTPSQAWPKDALGRHIGYMPQEDALLCGTIAENISRFDRNASERAITDAARAAGVHELILRCKDGYATHVGNGSAVLSAGQRQRIALARALYGDPFLVVLDEPNANLDTEGDARLSEAIASVRRRGGIAIVIAHRQPALAAVDQVLALSNGRIVALDEKQRVLRRVLRPSPAVRKVVTAAE